ncbi:GNAT family N-acetyltransferase [Phycicoccus flavus]|uniref:GNAT family N-acetyltransferase n=1 Tax=Phycicoccus flavus TaxID=2502783 RepID=UPI000FEC1925|nr:GNAT family N-acetyltransferase [Phycicoccus flavus]NHA70205.1 GNAT family N-acetyltransferase [Phycicoccus flavus]
MGDDGSDAGDPAGARDTRPGWTVTAPSSPGEHVEDVLRLYLAAFSGPPWHAEVDGAEARRPTLTAHLGRRDVEVLVAHDDDGRLVGVTYGWPGAPAPPDGFHREVADALDPEDARRYLSADAFELVELMVDPAVQGQGLGRALLRTVVGGRPAWLLTHPEGAGVRLYAATGWRDAGGFTDATGTPLRVHVRPAAG